MLLNNFKLGKFTCVGMGLLETLNKCLIFYSSRQNIQFVSCIKISQVIIEVSCVSQSYCRS